MALLRKNPRAADRARKAGDWMSAAPLYEEMGQLELAIDCYEKAGQLLVCAQLALQLDRPDREDMAVGFFLRGARRSAPPRSCASSAETAKPRKRSSRRGTTSMPQPALPMPVS